MKLYKVVIWKEDKGKPYNFSTYFPSTQEELKDRIKGEKNFSVWEVTIKEKLTKKDLISLLEGDAPGNQPQPMTPVDLIIDTRFIKRKEPKNAA